jgi:hypothetical protein
MYIDGKNNFIASAAEEISCTRSVNISRSSTLLIDDDAVNVSIALASSIRALRFVPHNEDW